MQKRGELTSSQIATLVLTIAGFVIALIFLLVFLDTGSLQENELCRLSVLTRATAPEALQRLAPLKCTTQKICLSKSGTDDCTSDQFIGEDKSKINKEPAATKEEIEKNIAEAMYNCWSVMGEGKLDLFGGSADVGIWSTLGIDDAFEKGTTCVICSRIAVSKDIDETTLASIDMNSYLETHQVPNSPDGKTYLQTFTDEQIRSYSHDFREALNKESPAQSTNEIAVLFMQINTEKEWYEALFNTGVKSGAFVLTSTSALSPLGNLFTFSQSATLGALTGVTTGGIAAFQTYRSKNIAASYCGKLTSVTDGRKGCSVITTFNYKNVRAINDYCKILEGQP